MAKSTPAADEFPSIGVDSFYTLRGVDDENEHRPEVEASPLFIPDSTPAAKSAPKPKEG